MQLVKDEVDAVLNAGLAVGGVLNGRKLPDNGLGDTVLLVLASTGLKLQLELKIGVSLLLVDNIGDCDSCQLIST